MHTHTQVHGVVIYPPMQIYGGSHILTWICIQCTYTNTKTRAHGMDAQQIVV